VLRRKSIWAVEVVHNRGARHPKVPLTVLSGAACQCGFQYMIKKTHFQTVITPQSKLLWVRHWMPRLCSVSLL